jgi:hypothetical protein
LEQRGATQEEVMTTITTGESFPAKYGRSGFRRNFPFGKEWRGKVYTTKQVEVYAVKEGPDWIAITCIARYF